MMLLMYFKFSFHNVLCTFIYYSGLSCNKNRRVYIWLYDYWLRVGILSELFMNRYLKVITVIFFSPIESLCSAL